MRTAGSNLAVVWQVNLWASNHCTHLAHTTGTLQIPLMSIDPIHSRPLTEISRHARQNRVLARLIGKASTAGSPLRVSGTRGRDSNPGKTLESWLGQSEPTQRLNISQLPTRLSDAKLQHEFQEIATMLYKMRRRLPTHPNYQRWTADPQARGKIDTVSRCYASNSSLHPATTIHYCQWLFMAGSLIFC